MEYITVYDRCVTETGTSGKCDRMMSQLSTELLQKTCYRRVLQFNRSVTVLDSNKSVITEEKCDSFVAEVLQKAVKVFEEVLGVWLIQKVKS